MLALYVALKKIGKEVDAFCDTELGLKFKSYPYKEVIQYPKKQVYDLSIALDCSDLDRLGLCMKSFLSNKSTIAIDHHGTHKKFADITFVDPNAAANCQNIYYLLKDMKLIDDTIARLIFTGLVTDSGCFSFSNTTKETFQIACELLDFGFDMEDTVYTAYKQTYMNKFLLENRVLSKAKFYNENQVAFIIFTEKDFNETNTSINETEGIISVLLNIDTVKIAYAISEANNKNYKVSVRTKEPIDAGDIALYFGGGGHKRASGFRINGYLEDIIERLLKMANDRL